MSFLKVEAVAKRFGTVQALCGIDLSVEKGSRTAIVGPSGSGKSTLLRVVAGFDAPDAGRVTLDGECMADGGRIVPAHRRSIGLVSQDGALFPHLDVAANIGFGLDRRAPDREARIRQLMEMVELEPAKAARRPHELSGGQQQRVALARALARRPKLMLLDEPFSALDTGLRDDLRRAVAKVLASEGIASLLVTHDQTEALSFADQVAVLRDGRLVQAGAPRALYFEPKDAATARFLGEAVILDAVLADDGWATCALGRLRLDGEGPVGPASILIRPEQLRLAASPEAGPAAEGGAGKIRARVLAAEFRGATCGLHLSLIASGDTAGTRDIHVRVSSSACPAIGSMVEIDVDGTARLLERGTASDAIA
ncbi:MULTISPECIES: ABC transporter ATP-binding protein [unclassified Aureimonas]|uniref:ABC transporter ATP-binding protein n=1 Tax=unclassified Aureimonas TaxID=2615206 RepID=UPI0007003958|nr:MULTISPECIES: ABC transporter ATP-binding protein [unclassified Aureimonas]KQT60718.1 sugar ABC transporter [Aureimonas sp. Leaf460]KQT68847.1 sugar ABC transporter [Aureimonas sp. Leaf427]